jgi:hypothetical protein
MTRPLLLSFERRKVITKGVVEAVCWTLVEHWNRVVKRGTPRLLMRSWNLELEPWKFNLVLTVVLELGSWKLPLLNVLIS